jgi:hypothetical protein
MAGGATYSKRLKERKRQDLQKEKLEKKKQRSQDKTSSEGKGPEIDWNHSQADVFDSIPQREGKAAPEPSSDEKPE